MNDQIKYYVMDDFIDPSICKELIKDFDIYTEEMNLASIHGGRKILPNTSSHFIKMLKASEAWKNFYTSVNNNDFMEFCLNKLEYQKKNKLTLESFFTKKASLLTLRIKSIGERHAMNSSTLGLIAYIFYRSYIYGKKTIIYNFLYKIFSRKIPVELLFDVSKSGVGYEREIHRDSDSRIIVFLLYFNALAKETIGGNLSLYRYSGLNKDAQRSVLTYKDSILLHSIKPRPGRLVIFLNDKNAYHAVDKMVQCSNYRYFCYGAFTSLNSKNLINSKLSLQSDTDFKKYI